MTSFWHGQSITRIIEQMNSSSRTALSTCSGLKHLHSPCMSGSWASVPWSLVPVFLKGGICYQLAVAIDEIMREQEDDFRLAIADCWPTRLNSLCSALATPTATSLDHFLRQSKAVRGIEQSLLHPCSHYYTCHWKEDWNCVIPWCVPAAMWEHPDHCSNDQTSQS